MSQPHKTLKMTFRQMRKVGSTHPTYYGKLGVDAKIIANDTADERVLYGTNGAMLTFYDYDSAHGGKMGALKKAVDAAGNKLTVDYYTYAENSNLEDLVQSIKEQSRTDLQFYAWAFGYIDDGGDVNNRRIDWVELQDGSNVIGSSEFRYYDSTSNAFYSGSGSNGDLMLLTVTERDDHGLSVERNTLFRYYTGAHSESNKGAAHKLKYIVGPQSYKELDDAVADPLQATEAEVATYADYFFEYDLSSFVTKASIKGAGCSCDSANP